MAPRAAIVTCVFCFDGAFAKQVAVALTSLLTHAAGPYEIFCITSDVHPEDRLRLEGIGDRFGASVVFIAADHQRFADWKTGGHFSPANYYRLLIPGAIKRDRLIYLDGDLLVTCDLGDLFSTDLAEAWLGGCEDDKGRRLTSMPTRDGEPYLNSGVLLMDLNRLREVDFMARCEEVYAIDPERVRTADQDLIHVAAAGRKRVLEQRWNVQAHNFARGELRAEMGPWEGRAILHFSGQVKPWMSWSAEWASDIWSRYAEMAGLTRESLEVRPRTPYEWHRWADEMEARKRWEACAFGRGLLVRFLTGALDEPTLAEMIWSGNG